eukprot:TRINITY_DN47011_c0_g1_i1.p1 TRINITY_DN47011_c0_g1~~TRINITY_DN47011_c0_g1_i1.p1  ORF type:complete len:482 (-),score=92.99 TRINITY_DN47011_c0_g1_i1:416-1861(-)
MTPAPQLQEERWLPPLIRQYRDFPMEPASGTHKSVEWMQFLGHVELRLRLPDTSDWENVSEHDFTVNVREEDMLVSCDRCDKAGALQDICGKLKKPVDPDGCWFTIEYGMQASGSVVKELLLSLKKKEPCKAWTTDIFKKDQLFANRRYFGWGPEAALGDSSSAEQSAPRVLSPGRPRDVDDPYVASRHQLCTELDTAQTETDLQFRFVLNEKRLQAALIKVAYNQMWGVDVSDGFLKVFIRGDEPCPVLLGRLGGLCRPGSVRLELTSFTRLVEGHKVTGTTETLPCLLLRLGKAAGSRGVWEEPLSCDAEDLAEPAGSLLDYIRKVSCKSGSEPCRDGWTAEQLAAEQKDKATTAFKEGQFHDAAVYYTRALQHTPDSDKLLCNRSLVYAKLAKFDQALADAVDAEALNPKWSKVYFRKGQALLGLKRYEEAVESFKTGKELEISAGASPTSLLEWEREMQRGEVAAARRSARLGQGRY